MCSNICIRFEGQLFMLPFFSGIYILRIGVMCFEEGKKRDAIVALLVFLKMRKQQRQLQQLM